MRWAAVIGLTWVASLGCGGVTKPASEPTARRAPDIAWEGWWPRGQWVVSDAPPTQKQVRAVSRSWRTIDFEPLETPWGEAEASLGKIEMAPGYAPRHGLNFWLSFTRPDDEWVTTKKGEIEACVVSGSKEILRPTNGDPVVGGGFGRMGMMTTSADIEFQWLPDDLADCWIRLRMTDKTVWILIPYGFGADDSKPVPAMPPARDAPAKPAGYRQGDQLVTWTEVGFDLGGVEVRISNPMDARGRLTLCRGDARDGNTWAVSRPRTTMAIGIPGSRVLPSSCRSVTRNDDNMRREDRFHFYRQPDDERCWGLLRVTVEDEVFERAIPSSLFLYCHGGLSSRE